MLKPSHKYMISKGLTNGFVIIDDPITKSYDGPLFYNDSIASGNATIKKWYSWKQVDSEDWSNWSPIDGYLPIMESGYNIRFKYEIKANLMGDDVLISSITLEGNEYIADDNCKTKKQVVDSTLISDDYCPAIDAELLSSYYAGVQINLNKQKFANSPIEVIYISYDGSQNLDKILKEYTNLDFNKKSCIKVIIDGGRLPDFNPQFSEWGIDFDKHSIFIEKASFYEKYGKDPTRGDVVMIPIYDRVYQVTSVELPRLLGASVSYWEVNLKKYDDEIRREDVSEIDDLIKSAVLTTDEVFGDTIIEESAEVVDSPAHYKPSLDFDKNRDRYAIDKNLGIFTGPVLVDNIKIADGYYHTNGVKIDIMKPLVYTQDLLHDNKFGLLFSFYLDSDDKQKIPANTYSHTDSITNDGYNHLFNISNLSIWLSSTKIGILDGNDELKSFVMDGTTNTGKWYGVCINYSLFHNSFSVFIWQSGSLIHKLELQADYLADIEQGKFGIGNIDGKYTNIRLFNVPIPEEKHRMLLSTSYINDDMKQLVLGDNVAPNHVLAKLSATYRKDH